MRLTVERWKRFVSEVSKRLRFGAIFSPGFCLRVYGGTDKWMHGYGPYYTRHLPRARWSKHLLLEIGVGGYATSAMGGGSLRVWRDVFPCSRVVGIDLHPKQMSLGSRVQVVALDQSDEDGLIDLVSRVGRPDVVIDDGSHIGRDIQAAFRVLWPALAGGGVYVIEDLHTAFWPRWEGDPRRVLADSSLGLLQEMVREVQAGDPTLYDSPEWGPTPEFALGDLAEVHVYPGIAFLLKRG